MLVSGIIFGLGALVLYSGASLVLVLVFVLGLFLAEPLLFWELGGHLPMGGWSWMLSVLSVFSVLLVVYAQSGLMQSTHAFAFQLVVSGLVVSLLACFSQDHIVAFYVAFEASALMVFFFIMSFGYQPERVLASLYLVMFTVVSSLPFLVIILVVWGELGISEFSELGAEGLSGTSPVFGVMVMFGFLVKFPMYFFHIWLPKAHVEASSGGSMVLAGVLLKLGSYGLSRVLALVPFSGGVSYVFFFSLGGGFLISVLCVRLTDLKVLIAYSSVAHMSLVISSLLTLGAAGSGGALLMSLAHGVASSALFFGVGLFYGYTGSRLFFFNSGALGWAPWIAFFWFVFSAFNMGTPPTFNFWAEILMMFSVLGYSFPSILPVGGSLFFAVVFSVILYMNLHGQKESHETSHSLVVSCKVLLLFFLHLLVLVYMTGLVVFL